MCMVINVGGLEKIIVLMDIFLTKSIIGVEGEKRFFDRITGLKLDERDGDWENHELTRMDTNCGIFFTTEAQRHREMGRGILT